MLANSSSDRSASEPGGGVSARAVINKTDSRPPAMERTHFNRSTPGSELALCAWLPLRGIGRFDFEPTRV